MKRKTRLGLGFMFDEVRPETPWKCLADFAAVLDYYRGRS
jgi:hypothetical protein